MVDQDRVDGLLATLARYVRIPRDLSEVPLADYQADPRSFGSAERFLQLAIETTLSVGHHIIAGAGFDQPTTYAEVFRVLGKEGVLDAEFAAALEPMARIRNRLVHHYEDVEPERAHELLRTRLGDFDRVQHVAELSKLLGALAAMTGQQLVVACLAEKVALARQTVDRTYLPLLETVFMAVRLPPGCGTCSPGSPDILSPTSLTAESRPTCCGSTSEPGGPDVCGDGVARGDLRRERADPSGVLGGASQTGVAAQTSRPSPAAQTCPRRGCRSPRSRHPHRHRPSTLHRGLAASQRCSRYTTGMAEFHLTVQGRGTLALPTEIRRRHRLDEPGAQVRLVERDDGVIELHPLVAVPADQTWFWSERWQRMEREAEADVAAGRVAATDGPDEFLDELDATA